MYCELILFVLGELWLMITKISTHNSSLLLFILSYWNVVWWQLLLSSAQKSRFILLPWLNQPNDQITFVMVFPSFCSMSCLSFRRKKSPGWVVVSWRCRSIEFAPLFAPWKLQLRVFMSFCDAKVITLFRPRGIVGQGMDLIHNDVTNIKWLR